MRIKFALGLYIIFAHFPLFGDEPDSDKIPYLIYPPKLDNCFTELQMIMNNNSEWSQFSVDINGSLLITKDDFLDTKSLQINKFKAAISQFPKTGEKLPKYRIYYTKKTPSDEAIRVVYHLFLGLNNACTDNRNCDIGSVISGTEKNDHWLDRVRFHKAYLTAGPDQRKEPGIGNTYVTAYAALTPFSKELFQATCVVKFKDQFDKNWDGTFSKEFESAIIKVVGQAKAESKSTIAFICNSEDATVESLTEFRTLTLPKLTQKLGFKSYMIFFRR
ncbi:MAG: hypothetical protein R3B84_22785 [Zavarzinella sp.]